MTISPRALALPPISHPTAGLPQPERDFPALPYSRRLSGREWWQPAPQSPTDQRGGGWQPMPNRAKNGHPGVEHAPLLAELLFLHVQAFQLAVWCFPTYLTAILASAAP
jgi:hypothetical protein